MSLLIALILASVIYKAAELSERRGLLWAGIMLLLWVGLSIAGFAPFLFAPEVGAFVLTLILMTIANLIRK